MIVTATDRTNGSDANPQIASTQTIFSISGAGSFAEAD